MNVSAVGFLFQDAIETKGLLKGKNYTCIIHKINPNGGVNRNIIKSPIIKQNTIEQISPIAAYVDLVNSLAYISSDKTPSKFIGATIKDGIKETEIHSFLFNKLYAVRTKDAEGKNHFKIMTKANTSKLLANNLHLNA